MKIPSNRLDRGFFRYQSEFEAAALAALRSGFYIMGNELGSFEKEFAAYCGVPFCVGLASGLDALTSALALHGVGEGDEVIVQGNTFIASIISITKNGAAPVFAEPDDGFCIDVDDVIKKLSAKTRAVIVTHLYGMVTPMDRIVELCRDKGLLLIEDCAQAHGAEFAGQKVGSFGDVGCFSFYPIKNLGAFGDGGGVTVKSEELAEKFRIYRNYGKREKADTVVPGINSRLDEIQAALLRVRLKHLDELNAERRALAGRYSEEIKNPLITLPRPADNTDPVWHQYVIRCDERDRLRVYLAENGIGTDIHYPIPPHLSTAFRYLGLGKGSLPGTERLADTVLSLPFFIGLTEEEQGYVINALNAFK